MPWSVTSSLGSLVCYLGRTGRIPGGQSASSRFRAGPGGGVRCGKLPEVELSPWSCFPSTLTLCHSFSRSRARFLVQGRGRAHRGQGRAGWVARASRLGLAGQDARGACGDTAEVGGCGGRAGRGGARLPLGRSDAAPGCTARLALTQVPSLPADGSECDTRCGGSHLQAGVSGVAPMPSGPPRPFPPPTPFPGLCPLREA